VYKCVSVMTNQYTTDGNFLRHWKDVVGCMKKANDRPKCPLVMYDSAPESADNFREFVGASYDLEVHPNEILCRSNDRETRGLDPRNR
jgi:hypothetical protein